MIAIHELMKTGVPLDDVTVADANNYHFRYLVVPTVKLMKSVDCAKLFIEIKPNGDVAFVMAPTKV